MRLELGPVRVLDSMYTLVPLQHRSDRWSPEAFAAGHGHSQTFLKAFGFLVAFPF